MIASAEIQLTLADLEATPDDGNRYELIDGGMHVSFPGFSPSECIGATIDRDRDLSEGASDWYRRAGCWHDLRRP